MKIGDRVRWAEAGEGGWAGDGKAEVLAYDPARQYFRGTSPATDKSPPTGPAVCLRLLSIAETHPSLAIVWVTPDEIMPDLEAVA